MSKTTREILFEAAELIRERGLAKFERVDAQGRLCIHGAVAYAASGDAENFPPEEDHAAWACNAALNELGYADDCFISPQDVSDWNNADERTAEEVITILEYAASVHA